MWHKFNKKLTHRPITEGVIFWQEKELFLFCIGCLKIKEFFSYIMDKRIYFPSWCPRHLLVACSLLCPHKLYHIHLLAANHTAQQGKRLSRKVTLNHNAKMILSSTDITDGVTLTAGCTFSTCGNFHDRGQCDELQSTTIMGISFCPE